MNYEVQMLFDGEWYGYGVWTDRNKANEIAMQVRDERNCEVRVVEK